MAAHTFEQRKFIVSLLATYNPVDDIAKLFAARFPDTRCSVEDITATDPRTAVVDPELHKEFHEAQAKWNADKTVPPSSDPVWRLKIWHRRLEICLREGRWKEIAEIIERISEETATNANLVSGKSTSTSSEITWEIVDSKEDDN